MRAPRPFYGENQQLKQFHVFHANVALNLKFICSCEYQHDSFLDAIVHSGDNQKLCFILTEQRLLIVDALEKTKIKDFNKQVLCDVVSKTVFKGEDL